MKNILLLALPLVLFAFNASAFNLSMSKTDITCFGANDGTATAGTNTNPALTNYQWSNGGSTQTISNLAPGTYSVTVTYNAQSKTGTVTITQPPALNASVTTTKTCAGVCGGSAFVAITGGTPPYTRHWSNGSAANNQNNICAGTYAVTVTDAHGCSTIAGGTVAASTIVLSAAAVPVGCSTLGSASVTVTNDSPPYSYHWSNGASTASISNLNVGTYAITVTNSIGCTASTSVNVTNAPPLAIVISGNNTCSGTCNGSASVVVSGGIPPYSYSWSNGSSTALPTGLCEGTYAVTVSDNSGCTVQAYVNISANPSPLLGVTITQATCYGACNGALSVGVFGGGTPTYQWSNGATTSTVTNLCAGPYSVTITNSYGCSVNPTFTITQPAPIAANVTYTNVTSGCNGSATVNPVGGIAPYAYQWSNGGNTQTITSLCTGVYSVTVVDAHGCTASQTITISGPLAVNVAGTNITCGGACNGSATANASGGTPPYVYVWTNSATTSTINNLCPGYYSVTVSDAGGTTAAASVAIVQPSALSANVSHSNWGSGCNDSALVYVSGGISPYSYLWSTGETAGLIGNLCAGTYSVTVTDAYGCTVAKTFSISPARQDNDNATAKNNFQFLTVAPNPTGSIALVNFYDDNDQPFIVTIIDVTGRTIETRKDIAHKGDNTLTLDLSNYAIGIYFVRLVNEYGEQRTRIVKQ